MTKNLYIVSNRLPVNVNIEENELKLKHSLGGLATGLSSFYKTYDGLWFGWPGLNVPEENRMLKDEIAEKLLEEHCKPVFIEEEDFKGYYEGFSNMTIWPQFHYFSESAVYEQEFWEKYVKVNRLFCDVISENIDPKGYIWIQDYHLMLLPRMLRNRFPDAKIGYFLHIPFPSSEVVLTLPWRRPLLDGMLGADLIGFHTFDYVRHFLSSVRRIMGYEHIYNQIKTKNRLAKVEAFPIGIDFKKYAESNENPDVLAEVQKFKRQQIRNRIILTIDRMDYTKGIPNRIEAFDKFLEMYPEYQEKVSLVMLSAPSRTQVPRYKQLKEDVDKLVGNINGKYGKIGWTPVIYFYRSLPFESVSALYHISDVAMVTPIRDGMNLVAKEFIAAKADKKGVLILSETAGAAQELNEALYVNPNNQVEVAEAIKEALEMPEEVQIERNTQMSRRIERYDIYRWAKDFLQQLDDIKKSQDIFLSKSMNDEIKTGIISDYRKAEKRLIFLDYDGTLMRFFSRPENARPDEQLLEILNGLSDEPKNIVFIISGRNREILEKWFGKLNIGIIAEHGVWIKDLKEDWQTLFPISNEWKKEILPILELFADRTPGSFVEEKEYSLVWHYRRVDPTHAGIRVNELKEVIVNLTENLNLGVLDGNKVVEIKNLNINKGSAAMNFIDKYDADFILALGDDLTDEDMFRVLPDHAYSARVGLAYSHAKYNIKTVNDVREFLIKLKG